MNRDTTPKSQPHLSYMPQQTHTQNKDTTPGQTHSLILHSIMKRVCVCVNQTEAHLGFVALLSPQTRAGGVELLRNDTQKLGLVLGSVAV